MLRYLRIIAAWLHVPGAKEILVVGSTWPTFNPYVTKNANRHMTKKHKNTLFYTFLMDLRCRSILPSKMWYCISMRKSFTLVMHVYIHLLHLRSQKMRFDRLLLFCKHLTSAKSWSSCKIPRSTQREGCLVIIFGPRNDTRSTTVGVHLVKKEHGGNGALEHVRILLCFVYYMYIMYIIRTMYQQKQVPLFLFCSELFLFSGLIIFFSWISVWSCCQIDAFSNWGWMTSMGLNYVG